MIRTTLAATTAALLLLLAASSAQAANYCVGSSPACTGSPHVDYPFDATGIADAVSAAGANPGSDVVHIAEGTITLSSQLFISGPSDQSLSVVGAGVGKTILSGGLASGTLIYLNFGNDLSTMGDFTLNVPDDSSGGNGIYVNKGTIDNFALNETHGAAVNFRAVNLANGATAENGSIEIASPGSRAIYASTGDANVTNVKLRGGGQGQAIGVSTDGTLNFRRIDAAGFGTGINADGGDLKVSDSLFDIGAAASGVGIQVFNGNSGVLPLGLDLQRVTIVGTAANQKGLIIGADSPSETFTGTISDLLIYGTGAGFNGVRCYGGGLSLSLTINRWASTNGFNSTGGCAGTIDTPTDLQSIDPGFRDFAAGDFRLRATSPLIDEGLTDGSSEFDLDGNDRMVDGNNDSTVSPDLGAYEYQRRAPTVAITPASPTVLVNQSTTFTADATDIDGDDLTYAWTIDGAASPVAIATLSGGFISEGQHTVAVTVTDETGLTGSASTQVTVNKLPPVCPAVIYAALKVKTKPTRAFKRVGKYFAVTSAKQQPYFSLKGFGGKYKLKLASVSKSKRVTALAGSQTITLKKGTVKLTFGGKWDKKKLKAGSYRLSIEPASGSNCAVPVLATVSLKLK